MLYSRHQVNITTTYNASAVIAPYCRNKAVLLHIRNFNKKYFLELFLVLLIHLYKLIKFISIFNISCACLIVLSVNFIRPINLTPATLVNIFKESSNLVEKLYLDILNDN